MGKDCASGRATHEQRQLAVSAVPVGIPDAATYFDPGCCPWCGDTGFDLPGLAHHVWLNCDVVQALAEWNIEDIRRGHDEMYRLHQERRAAQGMSASGQDAERLGGDSPASPAPKGMRHDPA